jgi:hypothetical protein
MISRWSSTDGSQREDSQSSIVSNASYLDITRFNVRITLNISGVGDHATLSINAKNRRRTHPNNLSKI